ncbi:Neurogenic locus delta, partial [Paramuricea clavata]
LNEGGNSENADKEIKPIAYSDLNEGGISKNADKEIKPIAYSDLNEGGHSENADKGIKPIVEVDHDCDPDPCLNGGTCADLGGFVKEFQCICVPGYTGKRCES